MTRRKILAFLTLGMVLENTGCNNDENVRLAEMAERHTEQQSQQNQQMAELHQMRKLATQTDMPFSDAEDQKPVAAS